MRIIPMTFLAGCGGLIAPQDRDAGRVADSGADAREEHDAGKDARAPGCPAEKPPSGGCEAEGMRCLYGERCKSECLCERGSWVCSASACAGECPAEAPRGLACDESQIDLECRYEGWCAPTCTCQRADAGEPRWACITPPC